MEHITVLSILVVMLAVLVIWLTVRIDRLEVDLKKKTHANRELIWNNRDNLAEAQGRANRLEEKIDKIDDELRYTKDRTFSTHHGLSLRFTPSHVCLQDKIENVDERVDRILCELNMEEENIREHTKLKKKKCKKNLN